MLIILATLLTALALTSANAVTLDPMSLSNSLRVSDLTGSSLKLSGGVTVWTGDLGLQVYEEIHENEHNRALHVAFLPFVFYGIFRGIPPLIGDPRSRLLTNCTVFSILVLYGAFYYFTGVSAGLGTVLANLPMAAQAIQKLTRPAQEISRTRHVLVSLGLIAGALVIQEFVGHSLWEETNSRMTVSYIVNAVLYSPVFFAAHCKHYYKVHPWSSIPVTLFQILDTYDIFF